MVGLKACAALSLAETVGLVGPGNLRSAPLASLITTFSSLVALQYCIVLVYNVLIYPLFVSPLRNIPGPRVSAPSLSSLWYEPRDVE